MNDCDFCTTGARPFYTLDATSKDGRKPNICHTCYHSGKHLVKSETKSRATPQPAEENSSTASSKR
jgi:hypothetical protein